MSPLTIQDTQNNQSKAKPKTKMHFRTPLLSTLFLSTAAAHGSHKNDDVRPRQGVFSLSNQPNNQVGVWESLDDGALVWRGRYDTGGVGYPDPGDEENLDDLGSSNAIHYHVWDEKQWLLAVNPGGPENVPSVTLFEIKRDLELVVTDVISLEGVFACSVAGSGDRACAMTCGGNVTMECFQITPEGRLLPEFVYDFQQNLPSREERPFSVPDVLGPTNLLFSPEGDQVGVLMKGSAALSESFSRPEQQAGFWSFPILDHDDDRIRNTGGYGEPSFIPLQNRILPFAFTWRPGPVKGQPVAVAVNIFGDCDDRDEPCHSSITSIATKANADGHPIDLSIVQDESLNVIDGCWIEYRDDRIYTANFLSDSLTVAIVLEDGSIEVERTVPIGIETIPTNLASSGPKIKDGMVYLYSENGGRGTRLGEIGVHRILEEGLVQVLGGAPLPSGRTGEAWAGHNGIAATALSEEELFDFYDYKVDKKAGKKAGKKADGKH